MDFLHRSLIGNFVAICATNPAVYIICVCEVSFSKLSSGSIQNRSQEEAHRKPNPCASYDIPGYLSVCDGRVKRGRISFTLKQRSNSSTGSRCSVQRGRAWVWTCWLLSGYYVMLSRKAKGRGTAWAPARCHSRSRIGSKMQWWVCNYRCTWWWFLLPPSEQMAGRGGDTTEPWYWQDDLFKLDFKESPLGQRYKHASHLLLRENFSCWIVMVLIGKRLLNQFPSSFICGWLTESFCDVQWWQQPLLGHFGIILLKMKETAMPCLLHLQLQIQDTAILLSSHLIFKAKVCSTF